MQVYDGDGVCREEDGNWVEEQKLEAHHDWVRDVAWAPSVGLQRGIIASCSQVLILAELETWLSG